MVFEDKWVDFRTGLWANVEPSVELVGLTVPGNLMEVGGYQFCADYKFSSNVIESLVARSATVSTGISVENQKGLITNLIRLNHGTPLEFITYQFMIAGISKSCSSQISRHRMASIVSASRRYQEQGAAFVYPLLESVTDDKIAITTYSILSDLFKQSMLEYQRLRGYGLKKGDIRYLVPVASATEKMWSINARSLRNFFMLRLHSTAESEIRRLAFMIFNIVYKITPTLFQDIYDEYTNK